MNIGVFNNGFWEITEKINQPHLVNFFWNISKKKNYFEFLKSLKEILENWNNLANEEKISFLINKFSIEDLQEIEEIKYFFRISDFEKNKFLWEINSNILDISENISDLKTSIIQKFQDVVGISFWWIWKSFWVENIWENISSLNLKPEENFSEIPKKILDWQNKIFQITWFFIKENEKKDKKISNQESKINYLEWENETKDQIIIYQNEEIIEKDEKIEDKNNQIIKKIKELKDLKSNKKDLLKKVIILKDENSEIKKSNENLLKKKYQLEQELSESKNNNWLLWNIISKITWENKKLKKDIEELDLTIQKNNASLLSFQNQINNLENEIDNLKNELTRKDDEISILQLDLRDEKDENYRLWIENDEIREDKKRLEDINLDLSWKVEGLENQIDIFAKTLKFLLKNKIEKEEELKNSRNNLNEKVEKTNSLKERMKNKMKK